MFGPAGVSGIPYTVIGELVKLEQAVEITVESYPKEY